MAPNESIAMQGTALTRDVAVSGDCKTKNLLVKRNKSLSCHQAIVGRKRHVILTAADVDVAAEGRDIVIGKIQEIHGTAQEETGAVTQDLGSLLEVVDAS